MVVRLVLCDGASSTMIHIQTPRLWAASLAALLLASSAAAQQVCHRVTINPAPLPWSNTVSIPKFNPALGVLTSIRFDLYSSIGGQARVENTASSPVTSTLHFAGDFILRRPDNSVIVTDSPFTNIVDNLAAFDGNLNYFGPSGETHNGVGANTNTGHTSPAPLADLALFTGPGSIVLPLDAVNLCSVSGGTSLSTTFKIDGSTRVDICYNYIVDCNHNGIDDRVDIQNGMPDVDGNWVPDECEPSSKPFCEGDGSANGGANCPCSNNVPIGVIAGCINSTGQGAVLTGSGNPSVSNDTFVLVASGLPQGVPGYFFMGTAEASQTASFAGLRCLGGTITRLFKIVLSPPPGGTTQLPQPGMPPISQAYGIPPGATRVFQVVYRSGPGGPCGLPANWTNGVYVVWGL